MLCSSFIVPSHKIWSIILGCHLSFWFMRDIQKGKCFICIAKRKGGRRVPCRIKGVQLWFASLINGSLGIGIWPWPGLLVFWNTICLASKRTDKVFTPHKWWWCLERRRVPLSIQAQRLDKAEVTSCQISRSLDHQWPCALWHSRKDRAESVLLEPDHHQLH